MPAYIASSGMKYVSGAGLNLSAGDNDIYTAPAGKRAFVNCPTIVNQNAGSDNLNTQIKISGVYYPLRQFTVTGNSSNVFLQDCIVLEPGESYSVHNDTNNLNFWVNIFEFDSNIPYYTPRLINPGAGDNTLYTVPAGKSAFMPTIYGMVDNAGAVTAGNSVFADNNSGVSVTYTVYNVPSGQTNASKYRMGTPAITGTGSSSNMSQPMCLNAGDKIVVNVSDGTAGQFIWCQVMEQ